MRNKVPHILVVLCIGAIIAAALSWVLPAGEYERTKGLDGRTVVVAETYHYVDRNGQGLFAALKAIPGGLVDAGAVVFGVLIVGGAFGIFNKSRAIDAATTRMTTVLRGKELLAIPIIMFIFATVASVIGNPELCLVYIPIMIPLVTALGFDLMTAVAITLVGVTSGFSSALINPFSLGIAQRIAELPLYSGTGFRLIVFAAFVLTSILYTVRYAKIVYNDPSASVVFEETLNIKDIKDERIGVPVQPHHKWVGMTIFVGFGILVYGILNHGWYMIELAGVFLGMTIVAGLFSRMSLNEIADSFVEGCQKVLLGAMVVGFARAIGLIMADAKIMDTIIYLLANMVKGFPTAINAAGMFIAQTIINFAIPSSSGQAVVAMPIMVPLADIVNVTRQTAVLAFQLGDGLSNILFPTSGYFMATLSMAGVPYQKWMKFFLPLMGIWVLLGSGLLVLAQIISW